MSITHAAPPITLDARDAQLAGAAIHTMLRYHDAASEMWGLEPLAHRDDLERLADELAPDFGAGELSREQENVVQAIALRYGRAAIRRVFDGSGDVIVCGMADDVELLTVRVDPDGGRHELVSLGRPS